ncbi:MAG TPA: TetR/AcrR family transcriptional regulator [Solirubrobacteraceae bacterium]
MARTRLPPDVRREQLLDIAQRLFEREPYDTVSFERIASEAGVSASLPYHYFETKREIFLALVERAITGFQRAVAPSPDAVRPDATPTQRLRAAVNRYLDFVLERPNGYAFVIGARGAPDAEVTRRIETAREAVHAAVLAIIGVPDPDRETDLAMWGWLGFVERVTTRWVQQGAEDREQLVDLVMLAAAPGLGR